MVAMVEKEESPTIVKKTVIFLEKKLEEKK